MSTTPHHSSRHGEIVDVIVEHFSAGGGTAASTAAFMLKQGNSAHALIDRVGAVEEPVDLDRAAWHAGDHNKSQTRGSRFPAHEQLRAMVLGDVEIVKIGEVPFVPRRMNRRSVGIEHCNLGPLYGDKPDAVKLRHRNRLVRDDDWEPYTRAQIAASRAWHQRAIERVPTILVVTGHEDLVHADTLGDNPLTAEVERKAGAKVDPGPAFPWDELLDGLPLVRVLYDFDAHGWRLA